MIAEIFGLDGIIVIVVLAAVLLFGGAKLPKFARSLGSAKGEFEKGLKDGAVSDDDDDEPKKKSKPKAIEAADETPSPQTRRDETTA
jgi:sec-independent protein translocase protein TatA